MTYKRQKPLLKNHLSPLRDCSERLTAVENVVIFVLTVRHRVFARPQIICPSRKTSVHCHLFLAISVLLFSHLGALTCKGYLKEWEQLDKAKVNGR